jgi:hypothetical protein
MVAKQRPGRVLDDIDRIYAGLSDSIDGLESFQTPHPHPGLDEIVATLRFVRKLIENQISDEANSARPSAGTLF